MQENRRREQPGGHVGEINNFVEAVQLPGVMEAAKDKRDQAKNIEMAGFVRAAAAKINE